MSTQDWNASSRSDWRLGEEWREAESRSVKRERVLEERVHWIHKR